MKTQEFLSTATSYELVLHYVVLHKEDSYGNFHMIVAIINELEKRNQIDEAMQMILSMQKALA